MTHDLKLFSSYFSFSRHLRSVLKDLSELITNKKDDAEMQNYKLATHSFGALNLNNNIDMLTSILQTQSDVITNHLCCDDDVSMETESGIGSKNSSMDDPHMWPVKTWSVLVLCPSYIIFISDRKRHWYVSIWTEWSIYVTCKNVTCINIATCWSVIENVSGFILYLKDYLKYVISLSFVQSIGRA